MLLLIRYMKHIFVSGIILQFFKYFWYLTVETCFQILLKVNKYADSEFRMKKIPT